MSITGKENSVSISIPKQPTDPLKMLLLLQSLFNTDDAKGYESWRWKIRDNHVLCISTNKKGMLELTAKSGWITFYDKNERVKKVDLTGTDMATVLTKFYQAVEYTYFCKVNTVELEGGNDNQNRFEFKLQYVDGKIVRLEHYVERSSSSGCSGDL
jgi:hypothetical protein